MKFEAYKALVCADFGVDLGDARLVGITDKSALNKALMAIKSENDAKAKDFKLSPERREKFSRWGRFFADNEIRHARDRVAARLNDIESNTNRLVEIYKYLAEDRQKLAVLEGLASIDYAEVFEKFFASNDFYKLEVVREDSVTLVTKPITLVEESAGYAVNMGSFKVTWKVVQRSFHVGTHDDNLVAGGKFHPHVGGSGTPCWGNATSLLDNPDPTKALLALQMVLTKYNPESPYVGLHRFKEAREARDEELRLQAVALSKMTAFLDSYEVVQELLSEELDRLEKVSNYYPVDGGVLLQAWFDLNEFSEEQLKYIICSYLDCDYYEGVNITELISSDDVESLGIGDGSIEELRDAIAANVSGSIIRDKATEYGIKPRFMEDNGKYYKRKV